MATEESDDVKARFEAALAAKNAKSKKSTPHGSTPADDAKAKEHADREGGKREFRRKSGG
jgi:hypothetical protein